MAHLSIQPGDSLQTQKFFDPDTGVEATEPTLFTTTMREAGFVMDGHAVDMDCARTGKARLSVDGF